MRRIGWWFGVVLFAALPAFAQSFSEVDAVVETFLAKDLDTVARHLPPSLAKALSELPAAEKTEIAQEFLPAEELRREGQKVLQPDTADVLVAIEVGQSDPPEIREIVLDKEISNGYEAMLRLSLKRKAGETIERETTMQVWLRFEEGEWRIFELEPPYGQKINLDDPKLLDRFHHSPAATQEAAAVETIRTYISSCYAYSGTYSELGYPQSLEALGTGDSSEPDSDHAGMLDAQLSSPPFEKSGYRFTYHMQSSTAGRAGFVIIGRPVEFGNPGIRSFYGDESGVIRFTEEDREPTSDDPPLK
jgi:hypothetical protein